jgi:hypothetical protein
MKKLSFDLLPFLLVGLAMKSDCNECNSSTVIEDFPTPVAGFNTDMNRRVGGYTGIVFMKCSESFTDITDNLEWNTKIAAGDVVVRLNCGIKGSKTSEPNLEEVGSCQADEVTRRKHTYTVEDGYDNSDFDVHALYKHIQANPFDYKVAFVKCDSDEIVEFVSAAVIPDKTVEDTRSGREFWNVIVSFDQITEPDPITLPFKITSLTYS